MEAKTSSTHDTESINRETVVRLLCARWACNNGTSIDGICHNNCPLQASWYADGYLRHGGKKETLGDIIEFAKEIAHDTGNGLPADFPSVEEMLGGTTQ